VGTAGGELLREVGREERAAARDEAWSVGWGGRRRPLPRIGPGGWLALE
jgi:hypothetical protein